MGRAKITFGQQLRLRREGAPRWSREKLAKESGVSRQGIEYIELREPASERETVIKLAAPLERAGKWSVDDALSVANEPPLTTAERDLIAASVSDPKQQLDELWPDLSPPARDAIVHVAAVFADRETRPRGQGVTSVEFDEIPPKQRRKPRS